jgi:hypothetical protein
MRKNHDHYPGMARGGMEENSIEQTTTLLDLRVDSVIKGVPQRIKVVKGIQADQSVSYALFIADEYQGSLSEASSDQQAVLFVLDKFCSYLRRSEE